MQFGCWFFWGFGLIDSIVLYDFTLYGVIGWWVVGLYEMHMYSNVGLGLHGGV